MTKKSKKAVKALFRATPKELGRAAVKAAKKELTIPEEYLRLRHEAHRVAVELQKLDHRFHLLQAACTHPEDRVEKSHGASTGGFDGPLFDRYWTDYHCRDCGKTWREDHS